MTKPQLVDQLRSVLTGRITAYEQAIASTKAARDGDSKSTAGDKHEVGRAMVQIEIDQQEEQLLKTRTLVAELDRIPMDRPYDRVAFGSLVTTDQGSYFISIGMGKVACGDGTAFVVSLASPIGAVLNDKQVGDAILFNGNTIRILGIE